VVSELIGSIATQVPGGCLFMLGDFNKHHSIFLHIIYTYIIIYIYIDNDIYIDIDNDIYNV
jgi:hypothetical protein